MNVAPRIVPAEDVGLISSRLAAIPKFMQAYIDSGKLAGASTLVSRRGEIAHLECLGVQDKDTKAPLTPDTLFRIYSMTKPITSLALMMLYEEGKFQLNNPVARYIPAFERLRVWAGGDEKKYDTKPCERAMTIRDLLTHTSGLTYGFMRGHPVDALYRAAGIDGVNSVNMTLADFVETLADIPLLFSPGTEWSYSMGTDVCGRLVEIFSGMPLDKFFSTRIFEPLGMVDTAFHVPADKLERFASSYFKSPETGKEGLMDKGDATSSFAKQPLFLSGGGGLVSTMMDYWRFCQMLLNGGEFDGHRFLSRKTIDFMRMNHLPEDQTTMGMSISTHSPLAAEGTGFGLGFAVVLDPAELQSISSHGNFSWGGAASTYFWIDPEEDLIAILMTQLYPSSTYPLRPQLGQLVYAAIGD